MRVAWARHRVLTAMVLLFVGGAWLSRGQCPMTLALAATSGADDSHDCCRAGLTDGTPNCCHATSTGNSLATVKAAQLAAPLASSAFALVPPPPVRGYAAVARASRAPAHSPPPTVLRV